MGITVGITGASGSVYGYALIRALAEYGVETSVILTNMGQKVMAYECGLTAADLAPYAKVYENGDLFAPLASGSHPTDGMVVIPCSMNTLGCFANGLGDTLLNRTASVILKEKKKMVLVVRETPYSIIHLENMLKVAKAGGCILPASPGFYQHPTEVWQLVEAVVGRVMDQLAIPHQVGCRWKGAETSWI